MSYFTAVPVFVLMHVFAVSYKNRTRVFLKELDQLQPKQRVKFTKTCIWTNTAAAQQEATYYSTSCSATKHTTPTSSVPVDYVVASSTW